MFLLIATATSQPQAEVLVALGFWFVILLIFLGTRKGAKARKQAKQAQIQRLSDKQVTANGLFNHTAGLPISENVMCEVLYCPNQIEITGNGTQFNLDFEKINDISMKTSVDIHKQYVSSAAGAVGGALLFGAVGALIGGKVKEKKIKDVRTYLIFTYSKNETVDYIAFDVTHNLKQAGKFVIEFHKRPQKTQTIDI